MTAKHTKSNGSAAQAPQDDRPTIPITVELHNVVDQAVGALTADPALYQRTGELVKVVRVADSEADSLTLAGTPMIRQMTAGALREHLTRVAHFAKYDKRAKDWVPTVPTDPVVQAVLARGEFRGIRPIAGIVEAPFLRPDGSICDVPGYDSATGYILVPGGDFPAVPTNPTQADAFEALQALCEVFQDFPYPRDCDRMLPLSAILTHLGKPAIRGNLPAHLFSAPTPGTGKGKTVDAVSTVCTGRPAAKVNYPPDATELEKLLGAYALRGAQQVTFDDIDTPFGASPLNRVLTAGGLVELRILGKSEAPALRWNPLIFGTGNNLDVVGDTTRRVLVSQLESPLERPQDRPVSEYLHHPLLPWVETNRPRLVAAGLTILRAWFVAGKPDCDCPTWGSFEPWAAMVPPAIVYAGGANPMGCRIESSKSNPQRDALTILMREWRRFAPNGKTVKLTLSELYFDRERDDRGQPIDDGWDDLRGAIEELAPPPKPNSPPSAQAIGLKLRHFQKRVIGSTRIESVPESNPQRWVVRIV
jgi:hypothetical protein